VREVVERMFTGYSAFSALSSLQLLEFWAKTERHRQDACASATLSVGCANWIKSAEQW